MTLHTARDDDRPEEREDLRRVFDVADLHSRGYDADLHATGPDGARWRVRLHRDAYAFQTHAEAARFDGTAWHQVRYERGLEEYDLPSYVSSTEEKCEAASDFCESFLSGAWHRVLTGYRHPEAVPFPDGPKGGYVLEIHVLASDLAEAGTLASDVADWLRAGETTVRGVEAHPWDVR